jgi:hypothetical protein
MTMQVVEIEFCFALSELSFTGSGSLFIIHFSG